MTGPGPDDFVWYQPPPGEMTDDQVAAFNERLNMEMLSFPSVFSVNLRIIASLASTLDEEFAGMTPNDRLAKMMNDAVDVTAAALSMEVSEARPLAMELLRQAFDAMRAGSTTDHDTANLVEALHLCGTAAYGGTVNPDD